jgi:asparagine synthase (glutamine-hydrolysing)
MCGIAGVLSVDPQPVEGAVRRMMRAMIHRGPDDEGYSQFPLGSDSSGSVCGFGFRRLAILDLSPSGHQPMINRATGDAIIFNGEIYNFRFLRHRLTSLGHSFASTGDTEVLLCALSRWGEKALDELDGMFALAFYHSASKRVLLARDPLGIKPLYVAQVKGACVFASEVRTVLASGLVPGDLDAAGIASFLAYGSPQDPLTIHTFIRSMPAACCEWHDAASVVTRRPTAPRRYWRMPHLQPWCAEDGVVARLRNELADSVGQQCAADVPLGVFLSGGIDSATMAALAETSAGPPQTFAVGYDVNGPGDETSAAAETARFLGTRHFQTVIDNEWVMMQWPEWLKAADRPSIDGLNAYIISGAVKDRGITVALSGLGADEIFGGYGTFRRVPRAQRLLLAVAWLPQRVRRAIATRLFAFLPARRRAKAIDFVCSGRSAVELATLSRRCLSDVEMQRLGIDARSVGLSPQYLSSEAYEAFEPKTPDVFQAVSQAEMALYMNNTLLRDSDTNSMAHSLEIRVPFLGQSLVNYCCSLPGLVRQPRGTKPKHLLRKAMVDTLPQSVFNRPKSGFSLPFADWLYGPLRQQCEAAVDALADSGVLHPTAVRQLWRDAEKQPQSVHWSRPLALVTLGSYLSKRR